jgi:hypothetical protein
MAEIRKLPVGIQSFEVLRQGGNIYVDKTKLIYQLSQFDSPFFLSRPRRFGKSLLVSAMENYFLGKKELFSGLAIETLETKWEKYPVLNVAFNGKEYRKHESLLELLDGFLSQWENQYEIERTAISPDSRFQYLIRTLYEKTGKKVVVLIDEYDKPILDTMHDKELSEANKNTLRGFYGVLKSSADYLRFVFITGITKVANLNVFSELNQLVDISMDSKYGSICGITQEELETYFMPEIEIMAKEFQTTTEDVLLRLKANYDGYHFAKHCPDIYNPFSLLSAFFDLNFANYWFHTGTPTFLVKMIENGEIDVTKLEDSISYPSSNIMNYRIDSNDPIPLMYQTGYLTIKEIIEDILILGYPNAEVRDGFIRELLPVYAGKIVDDPAFQFQSFVLDLIHGKVDDFMRRMQTFYAAVPFDLNTKSEKHYKLVFYTLIKSMGSRVLMEDHSAAGSCDAVILARDTIYIIEFKLAGNGTVEDAFEQIEQKNYAGKYAMDGKKIVKIAAEFDGETRTIGRWEWK